MKIVITGALGHIGSYVSRELPRLYPGIEVTMIDNMVTQRYPSLFRLPDGGRYHFHEADVLKVDLGKLFVGADVVLHLAAITNAAGSFEKRAEVEHVNYNATTRVAEACAEQGIPLIHLSSTSVYGTQAEVVDEDCSDEELKPQSPYAETKLREEDFLKELGASADLAFTVFRFGTICGTSPGMRFHTAVNRFCWQAVLGQPITVWRTALHQKRPYLTLEEALSAIHFVIEQRLYDCQIYNVLSANLTVNDIVAYIKDHVPTLSISYVDTEIMNQLSYEVLNNKFANKGFASHGDVKRAVRETIGLLNGNLS